MANSLGKLALVGLGILAYKNRDRLGELIRPGEGDASRQGGHGGGQGSAQGGLGGDWLGGLAGSLGAGGGLGELLDRFRNAGRADAVDSWVRQGPNQTIRADDVRSAIDEETLDSLERQTGLSREDILERLAVNLPDVVDEMTPEGRLPDHSSEASGQPSLLDEVPVRRQ